MSKRRKRTPAPTRGVTPDDRNEADRLRQIPAEDQRAFIAMLRDVAGNPKVKAADRAEAKRRASALARLLKGPKD